MAASTKVEVYLERGDKRVFAGALDWPGWTRSAKDEPGALQTLLDYAPRYRKAIGRAKQGFIAPKDVTAFTVIERLSGDATTDFGVPGKAPKMDNRPLKAAEAKRLQALLKASWSAFDRAVEAATGTALRKGPRGGGRDLDKIVRHVLEADGGYLARVGMKWRFDEKADPKGQLSDVRAMVLDAVSKVERGEPVPPGPRRGARWSPRYFVRRSVWHVLDHAWEIEDRTP